MIEIRTNYSNKKYILEAIEKYGNEEIGKALLVE